MRYYVCLFLCLFSSLYAAPVGNSSAPRLIERGFFISSDWWGNVRIGYEGDFVSDGKLEQYGEGYGRVDCYEQQTNSGTVTGNIVDRLDLFAVLGSSRTNATWRFMNEEAIHRIELETNYAFLWGLGIRGILYEDEDLSLTLGGRFETSSYDPSWATLDGIPQSIAHSLLTWKEWQIDLDASYKIDIFTPYVGVKYSHARSELSGFTFPISEKGAGTNQFKNRNSVGVFLGCALSSAKYFMLNVEARLLDEEAVTVSGDIRF
ncbi:MAG: hypothetical protein K2X08_04465 [Chlamydiales bacterium]|nr:hypothetical protein [Chlamydiales bacterium]